MKAYTLHVRTTNYERRRETFRGVKTLAAANKILSKRADLKEATWRGKDRSIFHNDSQIDSQPLKLK